MSINFKELSYVYSPTMPYRYTALDKINLSIDEGKITAIIGETGSGKSTLVQHLNALLLPSEGSLEIAGYTIKANEKTKKLKQLRQRVGLVFQFSEYQLFEETILKDVAFGPKNFGVSDEEAKQRAKEALHLVGIGEDYYERSPLDLSGGQKRRVAIAGIIAMGPDIIVLDEPTAGLDPKGADEMINLFCQLNKKLHKTIILVTHDNEVVYNYADDVVLVSNAKVKLKMDAKEFFDNKALLDENHILKPMLIQLKELLNERGFVICDDIRDIESLVRCLKSRGKNHE